MIGISTAYAVMFFGVPFVMSRLSPANIPLTSGLLGFVRGNVEAIYGPVNGVEALAQMILVPVALSLGGITIGLIIHADQIAY